MRVPPLLAFAICTLIWGTTWMAIKIGYEGLDAVWGASLRFLLAGLLLLPLVARGRLGRPAGRRQWAVVAFVGVVMFGLDYGLIYWGEQFLTSGLTAVLFSTTPLFVAVVSAGLIPTERVGPRTLAGILVGIGGVVLISSDDLGLAESGLGPMMAIVIAAAAAGITSVVVRRWGRDLAPAVLNQGSMLVGGAALLAASLVLGERLTLPRTVSAWWALAYLVVAGSILSFLLYWDLLKQWPAHRAILVTLLVPVVAVAVGLLVGERMTPMQWAGAAAVVGGVALSLYAPRPKPQAPAPAPGERPA